MTLELTQNGTVHENNTTIAGAPGVRISGTGVQFINKVNGQVGSTAAGSPAIAIEAAGAVIVNELGGEINAFSATDIAIMGSANADSVANAGAIVGRVALAGGADLYTIDGGVDVGDTVDGGAGDDRVVLTGDIGNADGSAMTGFERLEIGHRVLNVTDFSGYQSVTLAQFHFVTFVDSSNPLADLALDGGVAIVGRGALFQDITGTAAAEDFEVNGGTVTGSVDLGGGNDKFGFTWIAASAGAPTIGGTVNGGAGTDQINIVVDSGATIDMSRFVGFEGINTGTFTSVDGNVRLVFAHDYLEIAADGAGGVLTLANSNSSGAQVRVEGGGTLVLEATATIGSIAAAANQGAADQSFTVANNGHVVGNVVLSAGNDLYDGRFGTVGGSIFGGAGGDTFIVYDPGTTVVELAGGGNDTVYASASYALAAGMHVETLSTALHSGTGAIDLTGNELANVILGNAGTNMLTGGGGADLFYGFGGNDSYLVDNVGDRIVEDANEGNDTVYSTVSYALAAGASIETLSTSLHSGTGAIDLTGNELANVILGNAGANVLIGGGAADTMFGFGGNDTYLVDNAGDRIVEDANQGNDTVYSNGSYALAAGVSVETLSTALHSGTGAIDLVGNELANVLLGNAGANMLTGGAGADRMFGFGGNDSYLVDNVGDRIVENAGEGSDTVYSGVSYALAAGASVETLSTALHSGTGAIDLTGNELANILLGNAGANVLIGGGGADVLSGFGGDDTYALDNAGDQVIEGTNGGTDIVYSSVSYTLVAEAHVEFLSTALHSGTGAINLTGNGFANYMLGNAGANVLDGKGGNDTLVGFGGADSFSFTAALDGTNNVDRVESFEVGSDRIALADEVFAGLAPGPLAAGAFKAGPAATDADDRIIYNGDTGALLFDSDGSGAAAAIQFALLSPGLTDLSAQSFVVI